MVFSVKKCDVCGQTIDSDIGNVGATYEIREKFGSKWKRIDVCWTCASTIRKISRNEPIK